MDISPPSDDAGDITTPPTLDMVDGPINAAMEMYKGMKPARFLKHSADKLWKILKDVGSDYQQVLANYTKSANHE